MHQPTPGLPEFDYIKPAVDVKGLAGMKEVSFDPQQGLRIGAAVNMNRIIASSDVNLHLPVLAQAARTVASHQLRSRATIVGNVCNASPAGDTIGACIVLGGVLHVFGVDGERNEPLDGFFLAPGKTKLAPGDVAMAISFPIPPKDHVAKYIKLGRNAVSDLAIVGVTALGYPDQTTDSGYRFRLALASVAPVPLVPKTAEQILAERPLTLESIDAAADAAQACATPISDARGSARYRKLMVRNLTRKVVSDVWQELRSR
jgi:carbon-monoxide dehydrogenase medium subunit